MSQSVNLGSAVEFFGLLQDTNPAFVLKIVTDSGVQQASQCDRGMNLEFACNIFIDLTMALWLKKSFCITKGSKTRILASCLDLYNGPTILFTIIGFFNFGF